MSRYFFECDECEFDSNEAGQLSGFVDIYCPLCAEDNGRDTRMTVRIATDEEIERLDKK